MLAVVEICVHNLTDAHGLCHNLFDVFQQGHDYFDERPDYDLFDEHPLDYDSLDVHQLDYDLFVEHQLDSPVLRWFSCILGNPIFRTHLSSLYSRSHNDAVRHMNHVIVVDPFT